MKNFLLKYHLEAYSVLVFLIAAMGLAGVYELTLPRKLVLIIFVIGVFHEWEEKRWPGGFFENLGRMWGWDMEKVDLRAPGQWVVYAWFVIAGIPMIFDESLGLALAPMVLGIFEAFIHTAGGKLAELKGPYFPGIVTAWIMGIASVYCIIVLNQNYDLTGRDVAVGIVCMIVILGGLQVLVQKSANHSVPKMIKNMRARFKH